MKLSSGTPGSREPSEHIPDPPGPFVPPGSKGQPSGRCAAGDGGIGGRRGAPRARREGPRAGRGRQVRAAAPGLLPAGEPSPEPRRGAPCSYRAGPSPPRGARPVPPRVPALTGRRAEGSGRGVATGIPGRLRRRGEPRGRGGQRRGSGGAAEVRLKAGSGRRGSGRPAAGLSARPARGQRRGRGAPASPGHQSPGALPAARRPAAEEPWCGRRAVVRVTGRLLPLRAHKHAVGQETSEQAPPRPGSTEPRSSPRRASPGRGGGAEGGRMRPRAGGATHAARDGAAPSAARGSPRGAPAAPRCRPRPLPGGGQGERLHGIGARSRARSVPLPSYRRHVPSAGSKVLAHPRNSAGEGGGCNSVPGEAALSYRQIYQADNIKRYSFPSC